jgi:tetratricopeptide (TPR) repeat protein
MRLFVLAADTAQRSWEEAIPIFLQAEQAFGPASSQAARAACEAIQQFVNLGDYKRAEQEVQRVQSTYEQVMDPETKARLNGVAGWLEYYKGNLAESKKRFESCLEIAQLTGVERLGDGANHFLGKIYSAYGQMSYQKKEADLLFRTAEEHFQISFMSSLKRGNEGSQAFEIFRHSQLLQVCGDYQTARQFRKRAYQIFGRHSGILHIDIAEAKLELEEGEIRIPKLKAEGALQEWAHEKYARGMSNAITVLAIADRQQGKPVQAFESFIAALCIYPPQSPWKITQLWSQLDDVTDWLILQQGRRQQRLLVQRILEKVQERRGYFSYLDCTVGERDNAVAQIFQRLGLE